jgi:hypothetical protein
MLCHRVSISPVASSVPNLARAGDWVRNPNRSDYEPCAWFCRQLPLERSMGDLFLGRSCGEDGRRSNDSSRAGRSRTGVRGHPAPSLRGTHRSRPQRAAGLAGCAPARSTKRIRGLLYLWALDKRARSRPLGGLRWHRRRRRAGRRPDPGLGRARKVARGSRKIAGGRHRHCD